MLKFDDRCAAKFANEFYDNLPFCDSFMINNEKPMFKCLEEKKLIDRKRKFNNEERTEKNSYRDTILFLLQLQLERLEKWFCEKKTILSTCHKSS